MRHPLFVAASFLVALTLFALPANAGKPNSSSAIATITVVDSCSFEVKYTWSGYSGTGLEAELVLGSHERGGLDLIYDWTFIPNQAGSSGSVSATFSLSGPPSTHDFFGFGQLFKVARSDPARLTTIKGSYAESGFVAAACGSTVSVS